MVGLTLWGVNQICCGLACVPSRDSICRDQSVEPLEKPVVLLNPIATIPRTLSGLNLQDPLPLFVKMGENEISLLTCSFCLKTLFPFLVDNIPNNWGQTQIL